MASDSRYFSLSDNFVLEYIYQSDVISTSDKGFHLLRNQYDGRNYIHSEDSFFPINANILDKQYTTIDRTNGKFVYLDQDLVESYNNFDSKLTSTSALPIIITSPYDITYDTVRIHFRSGYTFDDSEGFYCNIQYKTLGAFEVNIANVIYLKSDSYKVFEPNSTMIGDILYNSYIDIKIPSLNFLKSEQKTYPGNPNKLYNKITDNNGLDLGANIIVDFGNIKRNYKENRNISSTTVQQFTFFELASLQYFTISPVDEYIQFFASIVEEDTNIGDYFTLQAKSSVGTISDYISYLNQDINTDWYLIHDIAVYEQIDYTHILTNQQHYVQESDFDTPILYRPVILNGSNAISYVIQYGVRLVNKFNNDQILKTAQFISTNPQKYGKKLSRLNIGIVPTIDKIYNKIQVNQVNYDYSIANKNKSIQEKYVINYYENNNICVINSDVASNSINLNNNSIKKQGECLIEIDNIDTFLKFNIYEQVNGALNNKNMNNLGDLYLTFIDNTNQPVLVPQVFDNQFDSSKGEIAFKIPSSISSQIITFTNPKFYILSQSQGQESSLYDGVWVSSQDYSQTIFTSVNKVLQEQIKNLNAQIISLNNNITDLNIQINTKDKTITDLNNNINNTNNNLSFNNVVQQTGNITTNRFQLAGTFQTNQVVSLKSTNITNMFKNATSTTP